MALSPDLLSILACPEDKGPLVHIDDEAVLFNPRLRRTYAIRDDIPIMLIDESTSLDDDEFERLSALVESRGLSPTFSDTE
ncbi:MAG: Trm112 family protein [Actinomycetota bacterium]